jgi:hypothetical protein
VSSPLGGIGCVPFSHALGINTDANIFALFLVPGNTDSTHPIDAGIGRCARIYIGHALHR